MDIGTGIIGGVYDDIKDNYSLGIPSIPSGFEVKYTHQKIGVENINVDICTIDELYEKKLKSNDIFKVKTSAGELELSKIEKMVSFTVSKFINITPKDIDKTNIKIGLDNIVRNKTTNTSTKESIWSMLRKMFSNDILYKLDNMYQADIKKLSGDCDVPKSQTVSLKDIAPKRIPIISKEIFGDEDFINDINIEIILLDTKYDSPKEFYFPVFIVDRNTPTEIGVCHAYSELELLVKTDHEV